jgi:hypothetical protein
LSHWEREFLLSCINEDGTVQDMEHCLLKNQQQQQQQQQQHNNHNSSSSSSGGVDNNKNNNMVDVVGHANGWTALFFASEANDVNKVQFLLDYGANVYAKDVYNRLPYQVAGGKEVLQLFCDYDEDGYIIPASQFSAHEKTTTTARVNETNNNNPQQLLLQQQQQQQQQQHYDDEIDELRTNVDALRQKLGRVVRENNSRLDALEVKRSNNNSTNNITAAPTGGGGQYSVKDLVLVAVVVMALQYVVTMMMTMYKSNNNNNNTSTGELQEF